MSIPNPNPNYLTKTWLENSIKENNFPGNFWFKHANLANLDADDQEWLLGHKWEVKYTMTNGTLTRTKCTYDSEAVRDMSRYLDMPDKIQQIFPETLNNFSGLETLSISYKWYPSSENFGRTIQLIATYKTAPAFFSDMC